MIQKHTTKIFISEHLQFLDTAVIKTLGHPLRLRILDALNNRTYSVKDLCELLGLEQTVVSQQLAILKKLGIVAAQRTGVRMDYRIMHPLAQRIASILA